MSLKYIIIALLYNNIILNLKYYTFLYLYDEKVYHIKSPLRGFQKIYHYITLLYYITIPNLKYYTFLFINDEKSSLISLSRNIKQ